MSDFITGFLMTLGFVALAWVLIIYVVIIFHHIQCLIGGVGAKPPPGYKEQ